MGYSLERREAVLKKMLPPYNQSISSLAKAEGISEATLYNWRQKARGEGRLMPDSDLSPTGWSSKDKFAAVMETAAFNEAQTAVYCRERGLFVEQLKAWRAACEQANDWDQAANQHLKKVTRSDRQQMKLLKRELARKEKALAEAAALLILQKKLDAMFEAQEAD